MCVRVCVWGREGGRRVRGRGEEGGGERGLFKFLERKRFWGRFPVPVPGWGTTPGTGKVPLPMGFVVSPSVFPTPFIGRVHFCRLQCPNPRGTSAAISPLSDVAPRQQGNLTSTGASLSAKES